MDSTLTNSQWQVLFALIDVVVPSIEVGDSPVVNKDYLRIYQHDFHALYESITREMKYPPSEEVFRGYMARRLSDSPIFVENAKKVIKRLGSAPSKQLGFVLWFMSTRVGSLISTGYLTPFSEQPLDVRERILLSWHKSWLPLWPTLARTFVSMGKAFWSQSDTLLEQISGYQTSRENPQVIPGPTVDFDFIQPDLETDSEIESDIIIVGSGCGGGVCAKVLAEAGYRILVVDKGYYFPPNQLPLPIGQLDSILQGGGMITTVDGSVAVVAGSAWGGGGSANYGVSLKLQDIVRQEWADGGLKFFSSSDYQDSLTRICDFLGVSDTYVRHNHGNRVLLEGSQKLGWRAIPCPQNSGGRDHNCGSSCALGGREGRKQGPAVSWLPAAAKSGARFMEGFEVSKVILEDKDGVKRAIGVEGIWTPKDEVTGGNPKSRRLVRARAKTVIVASGALNTPLLLMMSGLKNPNIGKHLYLQPVASITAVFNEDVRPWEGEIITSVVTEFDNFDGKGYGTKRMGAAMFPLMTLLQLPWQGGLQFKMDALKYRHMNCYLSIIRDRDAGSVSPDLVDGAPIISYTMSPFDRKHAVLGLAATAKLCYIQGAREILPMVPNISPFKSYKSDRDSNDTEFVEWLERLEKADLSPSAATLNSAHQICSCRMSISPKNGVVDETGKIFETNNLYVADASVLPSASGVNPMVTVMTIAEHIARGIAASLQ